MKKFILFLAIFTFVVSMSACGTNGYYENGYSAGYEDGYDDAESEMRVIAEESFESGCEAGHEDGYYTGYYDGYETGYDEGFENGERDISESLDYQLSKIRSETSAQYGISPYEAAQVLETYLDCPSEVTTEDLIVAIEAISYCYENSHYAINEIIYSIIY